MQVDAIDRGLPRSSELGPRTLTDQNPGNIGPIWNQYETRGRGSRSRWCVTSSNAEQTMRCADAKSLLLFGQLAVSSFWCEHHEL